MGLHCEIKFTDCRLAKTVGLAVLTTWMAGSASLLAECTLRIIEPATGSMLRPGQNVAVKVAAKGSCKQVMLAGTDLGFLGTSSAAPFEFRFQLPANLSPGLYYFTAFGGEDRDTSEPVAINVEREPPPLRLKVEPSHLHLAPGAKGILSSLLSRIRG